jgi:AcrR family transcriptional regulator
VSTEPARPGPGRPRSERARTAILAAAGELVLEGGLAAATIQAIAARAGVSRATVYKWWSSPAEVALDGLLEQVRVSIEAPPGSSTVEALEYQVTALIRLVRDTPCGPVLRAVAFEADRDPQMARALRERWIDPRRAVTLGILRRAAGRGEIRGDVDPHTILDMIFAPLYYRMTYSRDPLPDTLASDLVALAMRALAPEN